MSFAERVIRMRKRALNMSLSDVERQGDGSAIAAENIKLVADLEEQNIKYPRASSIASACMRLHVLGTIYAKQTKQWTGVSSRITFGIGNAIHWWIQNTPDVLGDKRRGWWRCQACNRVLGFSAPPKKKCKFCGARPEAIIYHEHYMKVQNGLFLTGHPDMFIEKNSMFRITEIKSITGEIFPKLVAPLADHEYQLQSYMWGCQQEGAGPPVLVDSEVGYIIYVSKKQETKQLPIKMFLVRRDKSKIKRIREKLKLYADGVANFPELLPNPVDECVRGEFKCYRARTCPALGECVYQASLVLPSSKR